MIGCLITIGDSTCKPERSQDHFDFQKMACIHLPKQKLYVKLTYCNHYNKNIKHHDFKNYKKLGLTKIKIILHSLHFHNNFITNPM